MADPMGGATVAAMMAKADAKFSELERVAEGLALALERIAAASPSNTNSDSAASMASWTYAVAATALESYHHLKEGVGGGEGRSGQTELSTPVAPSATLERASSHVEKLCRLIHANLAGSDPDELIHHPAQKSWEQPKWRRWEQWTELSEEILSGVALEATGVAPSTTPSDPLLPSLEPLRELSEGAKEE